MQPLKRLKLSYSEEKIDWQLFTPGPVVGVDEVGRGCLAGPVYAAAAVLKSEVHVEHLTDSKLISEGRREELAPLIIESHWVATAFASVEEIDELNILRASLLAMNRAVKALEKKMECAAGHLLIDGTFKVPGLKMQQTCLIKGDLRCAPISAAAIVAKVERDRVMRELAKEFPVYGFEKHKGYASPKHRESIKTFGPSKFHRKTFAGVKEYL